MRKQAAKESPRWMARCNEHMPSGLVALTSQRFDTFHPTKKGGKKKENRSWISRNVKNQGFFAFDNQGFFCVCSLSLSLFFPFALTFFF
jgi:hypothetical protein